MLIIFEIDANETLPELFFLQMHTVLHFVVSTLEQTVGSDCAVVP